MPVASSSSLSFPLRILHLAVLLLPAACFAMAGRPAGEPAMIAGAVTALCCVPVLMRFGVAWRPPGSGAVLFFYLASLGYLWLMTKTRTDALSHGLRGVLLMVTVGLGVGHDLFRIGAEPRRRARKWCRRLQARRDWPAEIVDVMHLPEVAALQDASLTEPGPVFELFRDPRPEVRAAAFAALAGRPAWRPRESSALLDEAKKTHEPDVRVLAMSALSRIDDPAIVEGLTTFFRDPTPEVRAAAVWAALGNGGRRWAFIRDAVRHLLSDPRCQDAALPGAAGCLPVVALCDLSAWAVEPEPLGTKAVRTLVDHYSKLLQTTGDYDLVTDLTNQVLDTTTPTALRVELAGLLRNLGLLTPELLDRMTNADQPAPVRLLAAEAMLTLDPDHPDGLDVLRGLGRQPNREMAYSIAAVLQYRLGYDMGLPPEGTPTSGRAAGEVAKRVMGWAVGRGGEPRRTLAPSSPALGTPGVKPPRVPMMPTTPSPIGESAPDLPLPLTKLAPAGKKSPW